MPSIPWVRNLAGSKGEQFVQDHAQRVDVGAGVHVQAAGLGLLGAHVLRGSHHRPDPREKRLLRQDEVGGLGDAEVDHLGDRPAVDQRDQDVRGLDVAVDDALLVGVLDGLADGDEQLETLAGREPVVVAILCERDARDVLHREVRPPRIGDARIHGLGNVGMVQQRERLTLGVEARHDLARVHADLDQLDRDDPAYGLALLALVNHAHPAFAHPFEDAIRSDEPGVLARRQHVAVQVRTVDGIGPVIPGRVRVATVGQGCRRLGLAARVRDFGHSSPRPKQATHDVKLDGSIISNPNGVSTMKCKYLEPNGGGVGPRVTNASLIAQSSPRHLIAPQFIEAGPRHRNRLEAAAACTASGRPAQAAEVARHS
ncbi:MAG TPA: hypothetical protein VH475_13445 [Tepidisphaeraceae bacterium]|jgi:hypothetical protein